MRLWPALLALWIPSCNAVAAVGGQPEPFTLDERLRRIDDFMTARPAFLGKRTLQDYRRLAALKTETTESKPNPHIAGKMLEYHRLIFEGLTILGIVEPSGEFAPLLVTVTSAKWKMQQGLDVGTPVNRVVGFLGPPMIATETLLTYQGTSDEVRFHVSRGVIATIELQYYFD